MKTEQILMCVVALILGMLLANMLKSVCGCKVVEGQVVIDGISCIGQKASYCTEQCKEISGGNFKYGLCTFGACDCFTTLPGSDLGN